MSKDNIDNTEAVKSKKKKEKIEVEVEKTKKFTFKKVAYSGKDLAAHADAVAGAKKAIGAIKKSTEVSETILKAYMYHNWCEEFALNGRSPDMRELIGGVSHMDVSQYTNAKVPSEKATALGKMNLDIERYSRQTKYEIRMGNVPKPMIEDVLSAIKGVLGDDMYENVVSKYFKLEEDFFSNFREIVQRSLSDNENLSEKMETAINLVKPTIQFLKPSTDLNETESYDLAFAFAEIAKRDKK
jgi:hypothetical protein